MTFTESEKQKIREVAKLFAAQTEISVAKIEDGKPFFYGALNSGNAVKTIENHESLFEIGSITKVLTASLLAKFVTEEELEVDSAINPLFPFEFRNGQTITFQSLATHTSGLPRLPPNIAWRALFKRHGDPYEGCDYAALIDYLQNKMQLRKDRKISYSNLGVGLLGVALEKYANTPLNALFQEKIFSPFKMAQSSMVKDAAGKFVQGLDKKGNPCASWDLGYFAGAGAMLSSTSDLAKFVLANQEHQYPFLEYQRRPVINEKYESIALGWFILNEANKSNPLYFHNGGTAGFSSALLIDIEEKRAFIALSNISGLHKIKGQKVDQLVFQLMHRNNG
ncbi:MAG: serine hydrolase domain-containing protein [Pseudomonadota bacterium]